MTTIRRPAPKFNVSCLIDDLSGCELVHAVLTNSSVMLTFRHLTANRQKVVNAPASINWSEVVSTGRLEPMDLQGRSRLLSVAPNGIEALRSVIVRLDEQERSRRAARAAKADVTLFGVGKTSSKRWGMIAAIDAAPVEASLKYSSVIFVKSVRLANQRLELTVEVGEQTLTAALQDPTEEALEVFAWGASAGRLMWFGLLEGMNRPEAIRVVIEDLEALHQELKKSRKTDRNGVLDG